MSAYVIVEITTHDAALMAQYRDQARPIVEAHGGRRAHGGRYIVRGGACETLEGD